MDDYVHDILEEALTDMSAATPASEHLFVVSDNPKYLNNESSKLFHHLTVKLLFLCKWAWPDIQTPVAFLMTRVRQLDGDDDYKKLAWVIKYLRTTPELALTLEADDTHIMKWWVDTSFVWYTGTCRATRVEPCHSGRVQSTPGQLIKN